MDDVLNKDKEAFIRQIEASNPVSRSEAQYVSGVDFTKYVKNMSVRYVSTVLPREDNLDDWIVLPLFQHGQDIPIDNDGRTAILLAHAPSLERLLEMWYDRLHGERHEHKEGRHRHKCERRESRHQKRAEKRRLKEKQDSNGQFKHYKLDGAAEVQSNSPVTKNLTSEKKEYPPKSNSMERNSSNLKFCSQLGKIPNIDVTSNTGAAVISVDDKTTRNISAVMTEKDIQSRPDMQNKKIEKSQIMNVERAKLSSENSRNRKFGTLNGSSVQSINHVDSRLLDYDDNDGILAMEQQLAGIQAIETKQNSKMPEDQNCEIYLESDHAASNLERELNGKPMECKKFKESLLRVEPLLAVVDVLPDLVQEHRPTKAELKRNSASNKVKNSLLQRMAEGREVDVDATNSVVCESDYKNTFCYLCRIDFPNTKGLYLHNVKVHSEGEVQCDICYKPLKNRITLMKHKKLHLGAEDMQCVCTDCGRPFKDKRALTAHVTYTRHMIDPSSAARS